MEVLNYKEFRVTDEMLAGKTKRFVNLLIDYLLFMPLALFIWVIIFFIAGLTGNDIENIHPLMDRLITALLWVLFYFALESITQRTIGKLVTQTKVVLENGEKPGADVIILRSLARMIPFEAFSFLGNSSRGWHDTMTKTYVVDIKIFEEQKKAHEDFQLIGQTSEI